MAKNTKSKAKTKKVTKSKKKPRGKKQESLNVMIELNKELNISKTSVSDKEEHLQQLQIDYMSHAKLHQEYSEKLEEVDDRMNKILSEMLILGKKYSSIEDFLNNSNLNNFDLDDIKDIPLETVED